MGESARMKNDEAFHKQQIRDMEVVLNRIRNIETDIYYLKNHPDYVAEWRCDGFIVTDNAVSHRCEMSINSYDATKDNYVANGVVVHRQHVTHLTTLHGERILVEWKNDGTTN
jgi:hypothetical protein